MRYRSITLNDNKIERISFVKYNAEYKDYLEELKEMNYELADSVEKCPTIYSELSDHQSYMIFSGEKKCIGAIYIGTSTDEKNLEIQLQFIEEKFENKEGVLAILDQIVATLGLYCFDKENIEIQLLNNFSSDDIDKYTYHRYQQQRLSENVTTYTTTNRHNNSIFPKLLEEMSETEQNLIRWKQCWWQTFEMCDLKDYYLLDQQLMQEYGNGTIPLAEIFYKAESVLWNDINSIKSKRNIIFERNGQIHFTKSQKDFGKNNYEFSYNITRDGFHFKKVDWRKNASLEIDENYFGTKMKSDNLEVNYNKATKNKKIQYISPVVNNSSISLELYINDQDEIEKCYVDFRTHRNSRKNKGKINGIYALRIVSENNICTLNFISRKGKYSNLVNKISEQEEQLFTTVLNGNLTFELIDEFIKKVIPIMNRNALTESKPVIASVNETVVINACEMEQEAIHYVKQIKGEIPLPYLQRNLERFIEEYQTEKSNTKVKR